MRVGLGRQIGSEDMVPEIEEQQRVYEQRDNKPWGDLTLPLRRMVTTNDE